LGLAPNPFWGLCTLALCKPIIRRTAKIGDWVIGTGSARTHTQKSVFEKFSGSIVYAMKITDRKSLEEYDQYCRKVWINRKSWGLSINIS